MVSSFIESVIASDARTHQGKVFLSFDIDWCSDEVLADTHALCSNAGVRQTYFVTHDTDYLDVLAKDPLVSLGIHPNFLPLLKSEKNFSIEAELDRLKNICPGSKVARSHGVVQGGLILKAFSEIGITHDSNDMIPMGAGLEIRPYETMYGITKVPFSWADEHEWAFGRDTPFSLILKLEKFLVFDFHPIHVFLNTESAERYEGTRNLHHKPKELINYRFGGRGTRSRLLELLSQITHS